MSENESVWSPEKREVVDRLAEGVYDALLKLAKEKNPQASAASAERVVELERQLAEVRASAAQLEANLENAEERAHAVEQLLVDCYVAREVPWTDVAAGMMTIARDGTPWKVESFTDGAFILQNGVKTFHKDPADGETVRVLVPYVTPEQAEAAVREQLGGTEVGS